MESVQRHCLQKTSPCLTRVVLILAMLSQQILRQIRIRGICYVGTWKVTYTSLHIGFICVDIHRRSRNTQSWSTRKSIASFLPTQIHVTTSSDITTTCYTVIDTKVAQGPVSLTVFPSQFKFDGNFVSISPRLHYRDRYKILYMARQLCCRGMCKNLLRSDGQQRSYGKAKFPSCLNCGLKTVSETGPSLLLHLPQLSRDTIFEHFRIDYCNVMVIYIALVHNH